MRRNKAVKIRRRLSNILLLLLLLAIAIGTYHNIINSRAEDIIQFKGIAVDNYGLLDDEEFELEAKLLSNDLYEVELPEAINGKTVSNFLNITIGKESAQIAENKFKITKEQTETEKVSMEVQYDVALLEKDEEGVYSKKLLSDILKEQEENKEEGENNEEEGKVEEGEGEGVENEEKQKIKIENPENLLYNQILKYEDEENNKLVTLKGYLPKGVTLNVKEVKTEDIQNLLEGQTVNVAYDITITIPEEKEDGTIEYKEINPEDFNESCEVTITDRNIGLNSQVYHIKHDNAVEKMEVKENVEENVKFNATSFSVYAVVAAPQEQAPSEQTPSEQAPQVSEGPSQDLPQGDAADTPGTIASSDYRTAVLMRIVKAGISNTLNFKVCTEDPKLLVKINGLRLMFAFDETHGHYVATRNVGVGASYSLSYEIGSTTRNR